MSETIKPDLVLNMKREWLAKVWNGEKIKVQTPENADSIPYPFKRPNRCPYWLFNEIAADFCGDDRKVYRPRKPSPYKQPRLFDMPTDKQKARQKARSK